MDGEKFEVCSNCPNRMTGRGYINELSTAPSNDFTQHISPGKARVFVGENLMCASYISADGKIAGIFSSPAGKISSGDPTIKDIFEQCAGPEQLEESAKSGLLGRLGLKQVPVEICPALREIMGDPTNAAMFLRYIDNK